MRNVETMPAWAARQWSRRLVRRGDEKVVRWISLNQGTRTESGDRTEAESSSNDNLAAFGQARAVQAS